MSTITNGKIDAAPSKPSLFSRGWKFFKGYTTAVAKVYLQFLVPALLIVGFSAATTVQFGDTEKTGLLWLRYNAAEDDLRREQEFPAHAPGSYAHGKRMAILTANDTAATTV